MDKAGPVLFILYFRLLHAGRESTTMYESVNSVTRQCTGFTHRLTLETWISVYVIGIGRGVP